MDKITKQPKLPNSNSKEKTITIGHAVLYYVYFFIVLIVGLSVFFLFLLSFVSLIKQINAADFDRNLIITLALFSLIITSLLIWLFPKWQVKTLKDEDGGKEQSKFDLEKERIKLRDDTRKTIAQIIGGVFFVLGVFVTYNTFELNREGQVTERYSKAIALLSNNDLSARLGGLYALERIAKDSLKDHSAIMKILAAYIRENSTNPKSQTREDIVAAAEIISNRNIANDESEFVFNFSGANLSDAVFKNAILDKANFEIANLSGANFYGAKLVGADFKGARLDNANFQDVDLSSADLTDTTNFNCKINSDVIIDEKTKFPGGYESCRQLLLTESRQKARQNERPQGR